MPKGAVSSCLHSSICCDPSPHASVAEFSRPDSVQRIADKKPSMPLKKSKPGSSEDVVDQLAFPAPLILPGDDLADDPEYPPQSFQEWLDEEERNPVTSKRKTIYLLPTPRIDDAVGFLRSWSYPKGRDPVATTSFQDVRNYVAAFYCGLPVKTLPHASMKFINWDEDYKKTSTNAKGLRVPKYVGLQVGQECTRIRTRPCPDGVYAGQLNLDDLLDAAIAMLPKDAYALMLLVDHDLYEDDEDTFVCGRAYGGSRVGVVSTARYNPNLDESQSVERLHAWPASHCASYVTECCVGSKSKSKRQKVSKSAKPSETNSSGSDKTNSASPMEAAFSTFREFSFSGLSPDALTKLWLGRICRTASHELGHCFGIDHCVYYACSMQGTGSLSEDARQPPYLCPIDLAKLLHATSATESQRDHALLSFCEKQDIQGTLFFEPFAAWIRAKLASDCNS